MAIVAPLLPGGTVEDFTNAPRREAFDEARVDVMT
jgi:hypothetical protein